jgi:hypothetical protein
MAEDCTHDQARPGPRVALLWKTPVGKHNGHDNDSLLTLSHQLKLKLPYTVAPGSLGGVLSNMAVADGSVYVATFRRGRQPAAGRLHGSVTITEGPRWPSFAEYAWGLGLSQKLQGNAHAVLRR